MEGDRRGIVEVEDRDVARPLPGDDVALRRDVCVARPVVVEMVLEDVRHDRDMRAVADRLELEAGELQNDDVLRAEPIELLDDRRADVPAHDDPPCAAREYAVEQRRGRRLPLRAGDAHDRRRAEPEEQPHLRTGTRRCTARRIVGERGRIPGMTKTRSGSASARSSLDGPSTSSTGVSPRRAMPSASSSRDFGSVTVTRAPFDTR